MIIVYNPFYQSFVVCYFVGNEYADTEVNIVQRKTMTCFQLKYSTGKNNDMLSIKYSTGKNNDLLSIKYSTGKNNDMISIKYSTGKNNDMISVKI